MARAAVRLTGASTDAGGIAGWRPSVAISNVAASWAFHAKECGRECSGAILLVARALHRILEHTGCGLGFSRLRFMCMTYEERSSGLEHGAMQPKT